MPPPIEISGRRFGSITVIGRVGKKKYAGRHVFFWMVRCDCGREEAYPQQRIPYRESIAKSPTAVFACKVCRQPDCVICCKKVPVGSKKNTCSEACGIKKRRQTDLRHYYKQIALDPDHNKKRIAVAKTKPDYKERQQRASKRHWARKMEAEKADPQLRKQRRQKNRQWYARHSERVQQKRKERYAALSPEEKKAWDDRTRQYGRIHGRKRRRKIRTDPIKHANYLERQREWRRRAELENMVGQAAELIDKSGGKLNE